MYLDFHIFVLTECQDTAFSSKFPSASEGFPKQDSVQKGHKLHALAGGLLVLNSRVRVLFTTCLRYADIGATLVITHSSSTLEISHSTVQMETSVAAVSLTNSTIVFVKIPSNAVSRPLFMDKADFRTNVWRQWRGW